MNARRTAIAAGIAALLASAVPATAYEPGWMFWQRRPAEPIADDAIEAEDIACLLFTGGTTGLPKAAQLSYRMLAWNILNTVLVQLSADGGSCFEAEYRAAGIQQNTVKQFKAKGGAPVP